MKKLLLVLVLAALFSTKAFAIEALGEETLTIPAPSALLMEKTTGEVIYEIDDHHLFAPERVT